MRGILKSLAFVLAAIAIVVGVVLISIQSTEPAGPVLVSLLSLGPLLISGLLACWTRNRASQITLVVGIGLFFSFFLFGYADVFYLNATPTSVIGLMYLGILSLPVMIPVWIVAIVLFIRAKRRGRLSASVQEKS